MEITINFASQPYQQVQRFLLRWKLLISATALLAVALMYASVTSYLSWRVTRKQAVETRQRIEQQDRIREQAEAYLNRPEAREVRSRADLLNATIARKAFSWTGVFADLEQVMPPHLHVTSIRPTVSPDGQFELQLAVVGSVPEAGIDLVRRLEQSSHFAQAQIKDESTVKGQGPGDQFRYVVTATYIPTFARAKSIARKQPPARTAAAAPELASNRNAIPPEQGNAGH